MSIGEEDYEPTLRRIGWREIVQSLLGFAVAAALLIFGLPMIADTTWPQIGQQLTLVGPLVAVLMTGLMLLGLYCYTFTLIGSLPGLSHLRALMVNAAGSMISNVLPAGGAVGVALSYVMFRSWGFTKRNISTSLVVTGVWNLMARLTLPVLGILMVLFGPVDAPTAVVIGSAIGAAVGIGALGLFVSLIYSDTVSHRVGRGLGRLARPFSKRLRAGADLDGLIQDQRSRMSSVVRHHGVSMSLGLIGMFGFFFVLYVVAARTVGVDLPLAQLFAAYAFRQFLTVVAITPGGLGVTEAGTAGVLVAFGSDPGAAAAAALLYAVFTHLLEIPLGLAAWLTWWFGPKSRTRRQAVRAGGPAIPAAPVATSSERAEPDRSDPDGSAGPAK